MLNGLGCGGRVLSELYIYGHILKVRGTIYGYNYI